MLMPGRYISDTSQHCMTISTTKWVTTTQTNWVSVCLPCLLWWEYGNGHLQLMHDTVALLPISGSDTAYGFAGTDISVTPGVPNRLLIDQIAINGQLRFAIMEDSGGTYKELTSVLADTRDRKLGPFLFTPTGNTIHLTVANLTPTKKVWWKIGTLKTGTTTTTTPVTVYETVCNEDKDKYRFGYAGGEKINEWAGIGNNVDMGERAQDTRTGRLNSKPDPLAAKFSWQSPYVYAGDNPIIAIDKRGKEIWIMQVKSTGEAIERVQYIDGRLYDKEGNEVNTNNRYINEIKGVLDNVRNTSKSVGDMITELQNQSGTIHNIQNFDPDYTPSDNRNYSISSGTRTIFNSSDIQAYSTPEASLSHELKHAYDRSKDQLNTTKVQGKTGTFVEAEWDAVNVQNQILYNQGKNLRCEYDGVEIPAENFVQPKENDKPDKPVIDSKNTNEDKTTSGMKIQVGDENGGSKAVDSKTFK